MRIRPVTLVILIAAAAAVATHAQERFSFFQASTPESVQRMLTLANLRDDDVVVDLGSGDGLIPLTAARMNRRLRGRGVDIDAALVEKSNQLAVTEGVADRVRFEHRNAFDTDLQDATVVTMWLFPELMRLLRPVILERARPGTRVLTSTWDLGTWKPDQVDKEGGSIFLWIVPARIAGSWEWELAVSGARHRYAALIEQRFQEAEGVARVGARREVLDGMKLRGREISFTLDITVDGLGLTSHEFAGTVNGDLMTGTARITPAEQPARTMTWSAKRVAQSEYFAPTGTAMFKKPDGGR